jgi:hypothetical protein
MAIIRIIKEETLHPMYNETARQMRAELQGAEPFFRS